MRAAAKAEEAAAAKSASKLGDTAGTGFPKEEERTLVEEDLGDVAAAGIW